jgi:membrane-associated phospholipid phosphatase
MFDSYARSGSRACAMISDGTGTSDRERRSSMSSTRTTTPRTGDRLALGSLLVCAALTTWMVVRVTTSEQVPAIDRTVHDLLWRRDGEILTTVAETLTWIGSIWTLVPLLVVLCLWKPRSDRPVVHAVWLLGCFGLAVLARSVLQPLIQRDRPLTDGILADGPGFSFPSGHTLQLAVALGLLYAVYRPAGRPARALAVAGGVVLVLAVGWTRLHLGVHWFSDVVGGALLGGAILALWVLTRRWRPVP